MSDNPNDKITADTPAEIDQKQPEIPAKKRKKNEGRESNPVRRLTKIVLYVCIFLFVHFINLIPRAIDSLTRTALS